jgi:hypothetical protein
MAIRTLSHDYFADTRAGVVTRYLYPSVNSNGSAAADSSFDIDDRNTASDGDLVYALVSNLAGWAKTLTDAIGGYDAPVNAEVPELHLKKLAFGWGYLVGYIL